jgi:hypothetical protein
VFGITVPSADGTGLCAIASVSAQNVLRQASSSPTLAWMPRNAIVPVASSALMNAPIKKSSLTARRVQPWSIARQMKPVRW